MGEREETGGGRTSYSRGKEKREEGEKGKKEKEGEGKTVGKVDVTAADEKQQMKMGDASNGKRERSS